MDSIIDRKSFKPAILVPYDFGPKAKSALREAVKISKYIHGEIFILAVVRKGDFISQIFTSDKDTRKIIRNISHNLKEIAKSVRAKTKVYPQIIIETGDPVEIILEQASIIKAEYIIMGKICKTTSNFNFVGPITLQVIKESPCPVITVGENTISEQGFKNIVLPIDLSKQSLEKVVKSIAWAKYYRASIHLIGVLSGGIEVSESRIFAKLEEAKKIIEEEGIRATAKLLKKDHNDLEFIILNHVKEVNGDLLMIMTHQEVGVLDNYIGSSAQRILKHSEIPVVSFNSKAISNKFDYISAFLPVELLINKKELEILKNQDI